MTAPRVHAPHRISYFRFDYWPVTDAAVTGFFCLDPAPVNP